MSVKQIDQQEQQPGKPRGDESQQSIKDGAETPKNQPQVQQQQQKQLQQQQPQDKVILQQQANQLMQNVMALNQQKQMAMQQGQQPNPMIDQQIYQYQVQYQHIQVQLGNQPQQQQQQQQQRMNQVAPQQQFGNQMIGQQPLPGQQQKSVKPNKYAGKTEKEVRQMKREEMQAKRHYKRPLIPESNEENMELGGAYQSCLYRLGECCGSLRAIFPCFCCVDYPFKQVDQGQEGIYQRFGKFVKTVKAGLHQVNPCTDQLIKFSTKQITFDMAKQWCITKDNIMVSVDGQLFYRIVEPRYAQYYCNNITSCVIGLAYTTIRTIVGHFILQDLFEKKEELSEAIQQFIEEHVWEWGVAIDQVMIKEITPTEDVRNCLNAAAKERRLAESKIISAKADVQSAKLMREAADILDSNAAMQIRYLETVNKLSNTSKVILLGEED